LTDTELLRYYKGSSALVFPANEDFGLAVLEAQMFGKPVIALREGGALETIISGKTGEFFYPQHEEALIKVLQNFDIKKYKVSDCVRQAEKFNKERFKKQFLESINRFFREK
jgi:glycosyltransferase involved in cell wall biosynthesis